MTDHLSQGVASKPTYEYRVMAAYRSLGREAVVNRPENPFSYRREADSFAASFKPPKFTRAWVERRTIGKWEAI